jgi:imidazolonepropionase-like amidohydrolase
MASAAAGGGSPLLYLRAARVVDGRGGEPVQEGAVLLDGERILAVGPADAVQPPAGAAVERLDYPGGTILPGLIDTHVHLNGIGDGRPGDDLATLPDEILLLQAAQNAQRHLASGVTTLRECGAKGRTTFLLRQALRQGIGEGPRLVLCGRPITITGGHLWYFGQQADGVDEVRKAVRQLVKEGADFIKVAATGGSTRTSNPLRAAFTPPELAALVDEARKFGKRVAAHCSGIEGVVSALDAGMGDGDTIIHCIFREPDGTTRFREDVARRLVEQGVWLDLTLAQGGARERQLRAKAARAEGAGTQGEAGLTAAEQAELAAVARGRQVRLEHFGRLVELGAKLVSGSDSAWSWYPIGEFQYEVIDHAEWGMGNMAALLSATRDAAACLGLAETTGSLEPGKAADVLVVDGDPLANIRDLLRVRDVFAGGRRVAGAPPAGS